MKCPKCNTYMEEIRVFIHHLKCENCEYEEKDIFVINEGNRNNQKRRFV